jgi:hypothetical protein
MDRVGAARVDAGDLVVSATRRLGVLAIVTLIVCASCTPPPIDGGGYELVFEDHFDTLDAEVWVPQPWYAPHTLPGTHTVADGVLTIRARDDNDYRYTQLTTLGPRSETYPHHPDAERWQEGYFEARFRYTNDPWTSAAFWFLNHSHPNNWPEDHCPDLRAEWDLVENGLGNRPSNENTGSVLHRNNYDGACGQPAERRWYYGTGVGLSAWHVWSGKWTADEVCTYLDHALLGCQPTYDSTAQPLYMIFSVGVITDPPGDPPKLPEYQMQVDWVRVWQKP